MKKEGGYGVVYQDVTRNSKISAAAKGLYAYLSAFCGTSDECYPTVETIIREMSMGKDTFYRHISALVAAGVVEKQQTVSEDGKFGRTVYRLTHEVVISDYPYTENADTDKQYTVLSTTEDKETKNNSIIKNNSIKNNNRKNNRAPKTVQLYFPNDELLNQAFLDYLEMRKQIKKPMTERAVDLAVKKLQELAASPLGDSMDNDLAIQILNQSVMNSWQSLFPLKEPKGTPAMQKGIDWSKV